VAGVVGTAREEVAVLDANSSFYRALSEGDLAAMEDLWAEAAPVACVHPGWGALRGRDAVMRSWRDIMRAGAPRVSCTAASAHVLGDVAFVVCGERLSGGPRLVATNVFHLEGGRWRMCHHQAGMVAREADEPPPDALA